MIMAYLIYDNWVFSNALVQLLSDLPENFKVAILSDR